MRSTNARSARRRAPSAQAQSARQPDRSVDGELGVLAVTGDVGLADELGRLALGAGVVLTVQSGPPSAREWQVPAIVLVGGDLARQLSARGYPRRPGVLLVTANPDHDDGWQHAVELGAEHIAVLPEARAWLAERLADASEPLGTARVVGVVGGCGGAGATVLAAAIAVGAARLGARAMLADLDLLGAGADLTLGLADVPGLRWPDLAQARGRVSAADVRDALPRLGELAVLSAGRGAPTDLPVDAVDAVLRAAARAHDLVVLDLPRTTDPASSAAVGCAHEVLIVVPAQVRAATAAAQLLARLGPLVPPVSLVVRCRPHDRLTPANVADALGLPLAFALRDDPRLDVLLEQDEPPGLRARSPLGRAVTGWLAEFASLPPAA